MRADDAIAQSPTLLAASTGDGEDRLEPGARVGDYDIERFLGAGAMGDVYAARHPLIGKRAAVKLIKRHLAASPEAIERFLREARAVNQVDHPNVVDVFAVGRLGDGRLFLVMDLLDGESLAARIKRSLPPRSETLAILGAIAEALDAAHARGVVHRDLKPDNVFLTETGVFVLDFGIAKLLAQGGAPKEGTLTDRGAWLGTPAYMAPEQWGADGAGPASDRYALGAIAFELLSGTPPFRAGSLPAMMEQHFRAPVPTLSIAPIDRVLARAMAKDPEERYPSGAAMVADLRDAIGAAPHGLRTRPALIAGLAVAAAAIATAVLLFRGDSHPAATVPPPPPPAPTSSLDVTTDPAGARVVVDGADHGTTPTAVPLAAGTHALVITLPGYASVTRDLTDTSPVRVTLEPVTGFDGVWSLPDGTLRAFERRGDQVAMFEQDSVRGERRFQRFFDFEDAPAGQVAFVTSEDHVDPRGAEDPSCHVALRAEYRYDTAADALTRRQERANITFADGRCVLQAKDWGEVLTLRREDARDDGTWAESTAGAGAPKVAKKKIPRPISNPKSAVTSNANPQPQVVTKDPPVDQQMNAAADQQMQQAAPVPQKN